MSLGRRCLSRVPYSGLEASSRRGLVVTVFYGAVFLGLLAGNGGHGDMVSGLLEYHVVEEVGAAFLGQRVPTFVRRTEGNGDRVGAQRRQRRVEVDLASPELLVAVGVERLTRRRRHAAPGSASRKPRMIEKVSSGRVPKRRLAREAAGASASRGGRGHVSHVLRTSPVASFTR